MGEAIPIYCQECNKANSRSAKRCIWCGVPISAGGASPSFEATRVEIDYLGGIERLDNPAPVRLVIDSEGVEISELMPGSRIVRIAASDLIEASVVDASTSEEGKKVRPAGWWLLWLSLGPLALALPAKKLPDKKKHDYMISIKYRAGDQTHSAVFHRQDRLGLSMVTGLARIITALVRRTKERAGLAPDE